MTLEIGVDETFAESVADRLRSIEDRLGDAAFGRTPFVTEAASHIINAGGKRFRPLLVVLASRLYPGADDDAAERAALVVELTHVASLYHDDVMDEADLRRGAESANHRWSNSVAIMVGDFLFAKASSIVATLIPGSIPRLTSACRSDSVIAATSTRPWCPARHSRSGRRRPRTGAPRCRGGWW